jgi:hypothetical protein
MENNKCFDCAFSEPVVDNNLYVCQKLWGIVYKDSDVCNLFRPKRKVHLFPRIKGYCKDCHCYRDNVCEAWDGLYVNDDDYCSHFEPMKEAKGKWKK